MSDKEQWKDVQTQLLQDIEAFARNKQDLTAPDLAGAAPSSREGAGFPSLEPSAAGRPRAEAGQSLDFVTPATPAPAHEPVSTGGRLLEKLRREAQAKQLTDSQHFSLHDHHRRYVSEVLLGAFQYLRDFCEQLNILKPAYPLDYNLINAVTFSNLSWLEGRADYRLAAVDTEDKLLDQVTLRLRLSAPGCEMRVERENPAHETFRNALFENNIAFKEDGTRNERGHVARTVFTFPCEVKAGLIFVADYKVGDIRLQLRNLQRFGSTEYRLPPEALTHEALDELGSLVLGEASRFEKMFRRVV